MSDQSKVIVLRYANLFEQIFSALKHIGSLALSGYGFGEIWEYCFCGKLKFGVMFGLREYY